jgi:hypothetical protein
VVINYFDIKGVPIFPPETDTPLVIDSDTVLPCPIPLELLQAVAGRRTQIIERVGGMKNNELTEHSAVKISWKTPHWLPREETLGIPVRETLNHAP